MKKRNEPTPSDIPACGPTERRELTDEEARAFFEEFPEAREDAAALAEALSEMLETDERALRTAYIRLLLDRLGRAAHPEEDETFLRERIFPSERVREYFRARFSEEADGAAPVPLTGGRPPIAAAAKPKTFADAGELARNLLK